MQAIYVQLTLDYSIITHTHTHLLPSAENVAVARAFRHTLARRRVSEPPRKGEFDGETHMLFAELVHVIMERVTMTRHRHRQFRHTISTARFLVSPVSFLFCSCMCNLHLKVPMSLENLADCANRLVSDILSIIGACAMSPKNSRQ